MHCTDAHFVWVAEIMFICFLYKEATASTVFLVSLVIGKIKSNKVGGKK